MSMVPSGRMRRVVTAVAAAVLMGTGLVWAAQPGAAVHDNGMFELDGNIVHSSATTPPYDWASLFNASGAQIVTPDPNNGPLLASGFIQDTAQPDGSYFSGSNKDLDSVSTWDCGTVNNAQDKDDLQNTYAALVQVPVGAPDNAGHKVLYLGSERDSNKGDSFAGFWLLKDSGVGCTSGGFSGHHTDGDILIVSNYTNGGGTQDVQVYKWTGDDATGAPVLDATFNGSTCGGAGPDKACAIANTAAITSPWAPTSHDANTFVEAGIDMTQLLGTAGGCFTSFMAETRTSQSIDATLKDFAAGQFNTCPPAPITTEATPGGTVAPGSAQHDVATLSAVGNRPVPTGTVNFFICGPQAAKPDCSTGGTAVGGDVDVAAGTATSPTVNETGVGWYCWRAEYTPDAASLAYYLPNSHTDTDTECFQVVHGTPTVTTQIAIGGSIPGTVPLTTLGDTATFEGVLGTPAPADSTVTFSLWGPYAAGVTPTCTSPLAATRTGTLAATANTGEFTATTSTTFTPTLPGKYVWTAHWAGNAFNSAADEECNGANEDSTLDAAGISIVKTANPVGPVSAGDDIGFDIVVANTGGGTATTVQVTDHLPGGKGSDLDWALAPAYTGCAISGQVGSQTLVCDFASIAGHVTLPAIHIQATTSGLDCALISNTASVTTANGGDDAASDSVTVNCPDTSIEKTADAPTANAGSQIGFTITVTNSDAEGTGTARDVVINDPLPSGKGIEWTIPSGLPSNCTISDLPDQVLTCTKVDLAPGASETVHVVSNTDFSSCGTYDNTAHYTLSNGAPVEVAVAEIDQPAVDDDPFSATASTEVLCSALVLSKVADAAAVNSGSAIGFTIHATNAGPGTALAATIADPLPAGSAVTWSIDPAYAGPGTCTIGKVDNVQTLDCALGDLAPEADVSVHITSSTTAASCGVYNNTASLLTTNAPTLTADASVTVNCAAALPETTPQTEPLAATGAGPLRGELGAAVGLVVLGGLLLMLGRRRHRTS